MNKRVYNTLRKVAFERIGQRGGATLRDFNGYGLSGATRKFVNPWTGRGPGLSLSAGANALHNQLTYNPKPTSLNKGVNAFKQLTSNLKPTILNKGVNAFKRLTSNLKPTSLNKDVNDYTPKWPAESGIAEWARKQRQNIHKRPAPRSQITNLLPEVQIPGGLSSYDSDTM